MVERLKGITTWKTVVVLCVYLGAVLTVTLVAMQFDIVWLTASGATTLGIVAGSLSGMAKGQILPAPNNPSSNDEQKKDMDEMRIAMSNILLEILTIKTQIGENGT